MPEDKGLYFLYDSNTHIDFEKVSYLKLNGNSEHCTLEIGMVGIVLNVAVSKAEYHNILFAWENYVIARDSRKEVINES